MSKVSYKTIPVQLPLSTDKTYVLTDVEGYKKNQHVNTNMLLEHNLDKPFRLDAVYETGRVGHLDRNCVIGSGELAHFAEVVYTQSEEQEDDLPPVRPCHPVQHPSHYDVFEGMEAITIIASCMTKEQFYGYCLGNTLKYRLRAGEKDAAEQDLAKAVQYRKLYENHKHLCRGEG